MTQSSLENQFPELFSAMENGASITYSPAFREFYIGIRSASDGILIAYCPFTGRALPCSLRDEWFDRIESLGLFPVGAVFDWNDPSIPPNFHTEAWWQGLQ
jgi:hypothetical protein